MELYGYCIHTGLQYMWTHYIVVAWEELQVLPILIINSYTVLPKAPINWLHFRLKCRKKYK